MNGLPAPEPTVNPESRPFWEATGDGRLLVRRCEACERTYYYPRTSCPHCASVDTVWMEAAGVGSVYSYTVPRQARGDYADATPYVLAYVTLAEGPKILTNIVDTQPEDVEIGQDVRLVFEETDGDQDFALPRFTPG